MTDSSEKQESTNWLEKLGLILRPHEQITMFFVLIVCACVLSGYFLNLYWMHDNVIDIDDAPFQHPAYVIDINQAEWPELANVPGLGESLAKAVIDYRMIHGDFESVEQLENVRGIGPSKLNSLRPYILTLANTSSELSSR